MLQPGGREFKSRPLILIMLDELGDIKKMLQRDSVSLITKRGQPEMRNRIEAKQDTVN